MHIFGKTILNTKWKSMKRLQIPQKLVCEIKFIKNLLPEKSKGKMITEQPRFKSRLNNTFQHGKIWLTTWFWCILQTRMQKICCCDESISNICYLSRFVLPYCKHCSIYNKWWYLVSKKFSHQVRFFSSAAKEMLLT